MYQQVRETSYMLQNLLHWANTQLNGYQAQRVSLELTTEVSRVIAAYFVAARYKKISLIHHKPGTCGIMADKGQLSIILHNLISNAIKYTKVGGEIVFELRKR